MFMRVEFIECEMLFDCDQSEWVVQYQLSGCLSTNDVNLIFLLLPYLFSLRIDTRCKTWIVCFDNHLFWILMISLTFTGLLADQWGFECFAPINIPLNPYFSFSQWAIKTNFGRENTLRDEIWSITDLHKKPSELHVLTTIDHLGHETMRGTNKVVPRDGRSTLDSLNRARTYKWHLDDDLARNHWKNPGTWTLRVEWGFPFLILSSCDKGPFHLRISHPYLNHPPTQGTFQVCFTIFIHSDYLIPGRNQI